MQLLYPWSNLWTTAHLIFQQNTGLAIGVNAFLYLFHHHCTAVRAPRLYKQICSAHESDKLYEYQTIITFYVILSFLYTHSDAQNSCFNWTLFVSVDWKMLEEWSKGVSIDTCVLNCFDLIWLLLLLQDRPSFHEIVDVLESKE